MTNTAPALPADLEAGLRRLRLATVRKQAPEVLATAKIQRWTPEETLRVLIDAEIAARDASNTATRLKAARFPVTERLADYDLEASSVPRSTHDYLVTLEWIEAAENLCLIGPAGTGKSHYLIALGHAAIDHGYRIRYWTAIEIIEHLWKACGGRISGRVR